MGLLTWLEHGLLARNHNILLKAFFSTKAKTLADLIGRLVYSNSAFSLFEVHEWDKSKNLFV